MTTSDVHPNSSIYIFACVELSRSLTSQFFLYMLNNAEINAVMEREFGGEKRATAKLVMPCHSMPGKSIDIALTDIMTNAKMTETGYNLEFLRRSMASAIISVHDEIKRRSLGDDREDMEFLRHVRNACGHGNCFTFNNKEPRKPARLHSLEITPSLAGRAVLFDFITIGDVVVMLDSITRRLDPVVAGQF